MPTKYINAIFKFIKHYFWKQKLSQFGKGSQIIKPLCILGKENIIIGNNVKINYHSWLGALPLTGKSSCKLEIHDDCTIGHYNEIFATQSIVIERGVLTADRVYISDNIHSYKNPNIPIMQQPIEQTEQVRIGEGSWLGVGVSIIGANIGRQCVIGANAVVTKDIPDYCVAVGIPAKIIKRYNPSSEKWERTNPDGTFIK